MNFSPTFVRRLHWLNLPGALLIALLQRTPVLRVASTAGEITRASPVGGTECISPDNVPSGRTIISAATISSNNGFNPATAKSSAPVIKIVR